MQYLQRTGIVILLLGCTLLSHAQRKSASKAKPKKAQQQTPRKAPVSTPASLPDTSAPKTVTITSAFKPFLKTAAKQNFTAASPVIDSSKIPVTYAVPSQNLFFSYQPVAIKPLALPVDSGYVWDNHQYIKLGAGNFSTYYAEAGFSFGDGKHAITNLKGNFLTSTGHLFAQQANKWELDALSVINSAGNHEWTAHAFYNTRTQYQYGFQPNTIPYTKDDLLRQYHTVGIDVGLRNKIENSYGITYHPQISFVRISDNRTANGYDVVIKAPVSKSFGRIYSFNLGLTADMSKATMPMIPNPLELTNNLYFLNPSIRFTTPNVKINAGIQPSWDNKQFSMLPDITAEAKLSEVAGLVFEAGWIGYYQKNTFRSLSMFNPWITSISEMKNTRIREQFAGVKGALGNHFSFQGRVSLQNIDNQPLFVNDIGDGKSFQVLYEPQMKSIRIHGEAAYSVQEKFSLLGGVTFNHYNSLSVNQKAYGLLPVEITGSIKWKVLKDLQLRADAFLWDGAAYRDKAMNNYKGGAVADLNFGAEFTVVPKLNLWLQMNNLLNSTYQRWNQYPVLGFNVLGGVVYSFQ